MGQGTPSAASEPVPNPLLEGHVDKRDGLLNKVRAGTLGPGAATLMSEGGRPCNGCEYLPSTHV